MQKISRALTGIKMFEAFTQKFEALQFTRRQQQAFLEDVSSLIEDGVPANQAVQAVTEVATGIEKKVADAILQKIAEGKPIADGMQGWFSPPIIEIIRAGEEGGTLAENMGAAARALSHQSKGFGSLIVANIYPVTVIVMGLAVAVFIKHSVFENFSEIKPVSQWPTNGQILMTVATTVENWWWLLILLVIAICVIIYYMLRDLTGDTRQIIDTLPFFSLYRDVTAARFMEVLGLLLTNGIILKRALTIMRYKATNYLSWHIYLMEIRLSGGRENIADVLDTGLIRKADILRLRLIAKGKGFEHALVRLGRLSADRTAKNIDVAGRIIGIVLLCVGAAWAAFMVFSIYGVGSFVAT